MYFDQVFCLLPLARVAKVIGAYVRRSTNKDDRRWYKSWRASSASLILRWTQRLREPCWALQLSDRKRQRFIAHIRPYRVGANMAKLLAYLFSVCCLVYVLPVNAKPCFITNCPPGGKRSGSTALMPSTDVVIASNNEQVCKGCRAC